MGYLAELDAPSHSLSPVRSDQKHRGIEWDTPLVTRAAAEAVWLEAVRWLEAPLPRSWINYLTERAETIYHHNARFRKLLRPNGNQGREWLWAFMRHWLSALILAHRPHLHLRLPASYSVGQDPFTG